MAKFLTTSGTAYFLEQLIVNAPSQLTLVTPYLQLSQNFIDRLQDADQAGIHITIIYGKDQLKSKQWTIINNLKNTEIYFCQNLHAKCYCNDEDLIISSMNLYEYSEKNNREMSILIHKKSDKEIYDDAIDEIESIKNASIAEKSLRKEEIETNGIIKDKNYSALHNFHLPYLYKLLQDEFPDFSFKLNNEIVADGFPRHGMRLQASGRIDLRYDKKYRDYILNEKQQLINDEIPASQIYFNNGVINIYEKGDWDLNEKDLKGKAETFLNIILKLKSIL